MNRKNAQCTLKALFLMSIQIFTQIFSFNLKLPLKIANWQKFGLELMVKSNIFITLNIVR